MTSKRKLIWVAAFILVMAVAIVLCVELFGAARETQYDGTLVRRGVDHVLLMITSFPYLR
jgi:hypothetical protein